MMPIRFLTRPLVTALGLVATLGLAGCAGTPDFELLRTEVAPETPLSPAADAELRVRLEASNGSGTLAETSASGLGGSPWPLVLQVDRRALERAGHTVHVACAPGPHWAGLLQDGFEMKPVDMVRRLSPLRNAASLLALYRLMRRERYHVVHVHTFSAAILGRLAVLQVSQAEELQGLALQQRLGLRQQILRDEGNGRTGIGEQDAEFGGPVHRIHRHHDRVGAQHRVIRDHPLRAVLQVQQYAVAGRHAGNVRRSGVPDVARRPVKARPKPQGTCVSAIATHRDEMKRLAARD